jgi:hypothetical protein
LPVVFLKFAINICPAETETGCSKPWKVTGHTHFKLAISKTKEI